MRIRIPYPAHAVAMAMLFCMIGSEAAAQWGGNLWPPPPPPTHDAFSGDKFTFCSVAYRSVRRENLGFGWNTDYPDAGYNFMIRLEELTTIRVNKLPNGEPHQVVVRLTDKELFNYPYVFTSDVGTADFNDAEVRGLREYLLRGGLLHVDDFWGDRAWREWEYEIGKVLPPDQYPIRDVPLSHPIFNIVFEITEVPQVPSIQYWEGEGRRIGSTSERGAETATPNLRAIFRPGTDRIMVLMSHNTDLADGWEKEREDPEYFERFSVRKSYPLGVNIVVYAMTH